MEPPGHHLMAWWQWVRESDENAHSIFLSRRLDQRAIICPQEAVPAQYAQVESWMRPRILACLPKTQREWVDLRASAGVVDASNTVYHLFKFFAPGSPGEKYSLLRKVLNPNVCTNPPVRSDLIHALAHRCAKVEGIGMHATRSLDEIQGP